MIFIDLDYLKIYCNFFFFYIQVGFIVEYKNFDIGQFMEVVINKLIDCSMYIVGRCYIKREN